MRGGGAFRAWWEEVKSLEASIEGVLGPLTLTFGGKDCIICFLHSCDHVPNKSNLRKGFFRLTV